MTPEQQFLEWLGSKHHEAAIALHNGDPSGEGRDVVG